MCKCNEKLEMDSLDNKEVKETSFSEILRVSSCWHVLVFIAVNQIIASSNKIIYYSQGSSVTKYSSRDSLDSKVIKTCRSSETLRVSVSLPYTHDVYRYHYDSEHH